MQATLRSRRDWLTLRKHQRRRNPKIRRAAAKAGPDDAGDGNGDGELDEARDRQIDAEKG